MSSSGSSSFVKCTEFRRRRRRLLLCSLLLNDNEDASGGNCCCCCDSQPWPTLAFHPSISTFVSYSAEDQSQIVVLIFICMNCTNWDLKTRVREVLYCVNLNARILIIYVIVRESPTPSCFHPRHNGQTTNEAAPVGCRVLSLCCWISGTKLRWLVGKRSWTIQHHRWDRTGFNQIVIG